MVAFDAAIRTALDLTDREDTLIVVTADHSHTMTINGYPKRDNPLLGLVVDVEDELTLGLDGKPYTTLSYANGPGGVFPEAAERIVAEKIAPALPEAGGATDATAALDAGKIAQPEAPAVAETQASVAAPAAAPPAAPETETETEKVARPDLTDVNTEHVDFVQNSLVPLASETHGGDDVAVFGWGPSAHAFHGVIEQNLIFHVMAHAIGLPRPAAAPAP
jgi:alkaline phosphatase